MNTVEVGAIAGQGTPISEDRITNFRLSSERLPIWRTAWAVGLISLNALIPGCGERESTSDQKEAISALQGRSDDENGLHSESQRPNPGRRAYYEPPLRADTPLPTVVTTLAPVPKSENIFEKIKVLSKDGQSQVERSVVTIFGMQYEVLAIPVCMAEVGPGKWTPGFRLPSRSKAYTNDGKTSGFCELRYMDPLENSNLKLLLRVENSGMTDAEKMGVQLSSLIVTHQSTSTEENKPWATLETIGCLIVDRNDHRNQTAIKHTIIKNSEISRTYLHNSLIGLTDYPDGSNFSLKNESGRTAVISIYMLKSPTE